MANPPFNQKDWRSKDELIDDHRWRGYEFHLYQMQIMDGY